MYYVELKKRGGKWQVGAVYDETTVAFEPVFDGVNADVVKVEESVALAIPPVAVFNKDTEAFEVDMDNVRYVRNQHLSNYDKYLAADYTGPALTDEQKAECAVWRTRLRDIPQEHADPMDAWTALCELLRQQPVVEA